MNTEEILEGLKYYNGVFPRRALQEAVASKDEITPALLKIIEDAKLAPRVLLNDKYMAHIYAMYLLAQFREKRAYPLIVDFFSVPGEITLECTGDVVTEDLHRILASVCHGDVGLVKSLAENDAANEYVRGAALETLLTQLVCGQSRREEVMGYYESLFRGGLTRVPSLVWASLVSCSTDLYPEEVMTDIHQAYEEGLVDEMYIDLEFVREQFARGKETVLRELQRDRKRRFIEDTIEDIEWWACFRNPQEGRRQIVEERIHKATEKVGRNAPCPCGSGKKYKKCCGRHVSAEPQMPQFDGRLMDRHLLALEQTLEGKNFGSVEEMNRYTEETINRIGRIPQWTPKTPLQQAQSLIFEALETVGEKRLELAEQALKMSPDCADAYVLLAEERAQSLEEATGLYEAGVEAGERALGKKVFEEEAGHFWGVVRTRPYMRARAGLAQCLWVAGKREEAVSHYRELLRLNPSDNQGIRYLLAASLLELGQIDAVGELLGQYDEPTANWLYTKALVAYVKQGDSAEARKLLREAYDYNPHVATYLLGEKKLPRVLPERIGFGDKDEGVTYAAEFGTAWHRIGGAVDWLASVCGRVQGTWQAPTKPAGIPDAFLRAFEREDKGRHPKQQDGNDQEG